MGSEYITRFPPAQSSAIVSVMSERAVIAVPIAQPSSEEAIAFCSDAERVADWIEFRLDYLEDLKRESLTRAMLSLIQSGRKPMIFTYRPITEGGRAPADLRHRRDIWQALFASCQELRDRAGLLFDLELDLVEYLVEQSMACPWSQVIASWHAFETLPDDLETIYRRAAATPARILKIAVAVRDVHEVVGIFHLLQRARDERRPLIALAMGMPGIITRILGPAYGSVLSYGTLSPDRQTAPGQPLARHLKDLYRVNEVTRRTKVYGVMGKPIGHSLSPVIHNAWMQQAGHDAVYVPFEVSDVRAFLTHIVQPETRRVPWPVGGLSVTLPHKVSVVNYLDAIDPLALRVGAVNTIVLQENKLIGFNTDVAGFIRPLLSRMDVKGARAIIVGTGGAARAAAVGLAEQGAQLTIVGRDKERTLALAKLVDAQTGSLDELSKLSGDVLVQATPVGMTGYQGHLIIPTELLEKVRLVYDLVYNPVETDLLRRARQAGCDTLGGLEMFLHQAAEQFFLWFGSRPSIELAQAIVKTEHRLSPSGLDRGFHSEG